MANWAILVPVKCQVLIVRLLHLIKPQGKANQDLLANEVSKLLIRVWLGLIVLKCLFFWSEPEPEQISWIWWLRASFTLGLTLKKSGGEIKRNSGWIGQIPYFPQNAEPLKTKFSQILASPVRIKGGIKEFRRGIRKSLILSLRLWAWVGHAAQHLVAAPPSPRRSQPRRRTTHESPPHT
jgi:hypothetical protein